MKLFDYETNSHGAEERLAELVMETANMLTRAIRQEMRRRRPEGLSLQQFRALGVIQRHPGASLSVIAGHLGLTNATASKLVDGLVKQELVARVESEEDRRVLVLNTTEAGNRALQSARTAALGWLAELLAGLDKSNHATVMKAMEILHAALTRASASENIQAE